MPILRPTAPFELRTTYSCHWRQTLSSIRLRMLCCPVARNNVSPLNLALEDHLKNPVSHHPSGLPRAGAFHRRYMNSTSAMASTEATLRTFFQFPKYAVVGASTNTAKYGYKIFRWYITHGLPVTPINPGAQAINVEGTDYPTVGALSDLQGTEETGVSFITPPHITLKTLEEAKRLGIQAIFLQPGTFDDDVLAYARANFRTVLAGGGGAGSEGWCVLVDGERGLAAAGKL
ncbi:NAD(P)-binding protein [Parathielavia appendiculata]|uniref:NAD(P)-binding protein n=1 Tax=Parathielavia appendiculata TaxID=2587402 RepID=A0AAN6Z5Z5_9PEZI|nr:NAD(P)-binding protein [Parathielavia appendiculata]